MTREQMRDFEKAEDILTKLYFSLKDEKGNGATVKKLDTILDKMFKLKNQIGQ